MKLRQLTAAGIEQILQFIQRLREGSTEGVPHELLNGSESTREIAGSPEVSHQQFKSRFAFAAWIAEQLDAVGDRAVAEDPAFWAWLTVFLFDEVCPVDSETGRRKVRADYRYIPSFGIWKHFYRHLLAGPYSIYRAHRDNPGAARALLVQPLHSPGDVVEQIASRRELATSPAVVGAATLLYLNGATGKLRRGSGGKDAGSARRFSKVMMQLDVTYDLFTLTPDQLVQILPGEFDRFRSPSGAAS